MAVWAAGAKRGKDGIANDAFQRASRQAAVGFHVADLGFDGTSSAEVCDEFWCQPAPRAADQDAGFVFAMAAVAVIDDCQIGALVGHRSSTLRP